MLLEKRSAVRNLRGRRLVLRREALDAVYDNRAFEREPVVDPPIILALAQSERSERREQQVARIVTGERSPRPVRAMLARSQASECQPRVGVAERINRRIPPIGMLGLTFPPKRNQPLASLAIARRLGSGQRAVNLHASAIGAGS